MTEGLVAGAEPPRSRRGRRSDPNATRQAIIDAAHEIMDAEGEAAVRVHDVARIAGVTTGAIYAHFTNREELVAAVNLAQVATVVAQVRERLLERVVAEHDHPYFDGGYLDDIRAYLTGLERIHFIRWAAIAAKAEVDPELAAAVEPFERELIDVMTEQMELLQRRGYLPAGISPRAAAIIRLGTIIGTAVTISAALNDDPTIVDEVLRAWRPMTGIVLSPEDLQRNLR